MTGIGVMDSAVPPTPSAAGVGSYSLEVAGRVASVATATVSNVVVGMIGSEVGLSVQGSSMKLQW